MMNFDEFPNDDIIEDAMDAAIQALIPHGAGPVNTIRLVHQLKRVAYIAYQQGVMAGNSEIMTTSEIEQKFGLQPGTVRAWLNRHPEMGWKSAGTWLMRRSTAEELWGNRE